MRTGFVQVVIAGPEAGRVEIPGCGVVNIYISMKKSFASRSGGHGYAMLLSLLHKAALSRLSGVSAGSSYGRLLALYFLKDNGMMPACIKP
jgi:hypothetical protein